MWNRKQFKKNAKKTFNFKRNYWYAVAVCFIMAFVGVDYTESLYKIHQYRQNNYSYNETTTKIVKSTNWDIFDDILQDYKLKYNPNTIMDWESGQIFKITFDKASNDQGVLLKLIESYNTFFIEKNTTKGLTLLLGSILLFFFAIFVVNILRVGRRVFFLKNRQDPDTKIKNIFYPYSEKHMYINIFKIMLSRYIYQFLWMLTIVGGIIKVYEYRMIPYIIAEQPKIECKQAFELSRKMIKGYKWKMFILDISFLLWDILEIMTFGLFGIFYLNPYKASTEAEVYIELKKILSKKNRA